MNNSLNPLLLAIRAVARKRLHFAATSALMLPLLSFGQTPPPEPPITGDVSEEIEEVIVTGVRKAIEKSQTVKKKANTIMESVSAEDIGKFPDQSVSDALQRITGIQIEKDATGQSSLFQIRGISQNRVEINGRTSTASSGPDGEGRTSDLSAIPAELIGSLDVYKSVSADMIEGSLGATVNLKTAKPFQLKNKTVVSVKQKYGDNIEVPYGNYTLTKSLLWKETEIGKIGVMGSLIYQDDRVSSDRFQVSGWGNKCSFYGLKSTGMGAMKPATATTPATPYVKGEFYSTSSTKQPINDCVRLQADHPEETIAQVFAPDSPGFLQTDEDREKKAAQLAVQWQPNDDMEFLLEGEYFKKSTDERRNTFRISTLTEPYNLNKNYFGADGQTVYNQWKNVTLGAPSYTWNVDTPVYDLVPVSYYEAKNATFNAAQAQGFQIIQDNAAVALEGKWHISDSVLLKGELEHSNASVERHFFNTNLSRYIVANPNAAVTNDQLVQTYAAPATPTVPAVPPGAALRSGGSPAIFDLRDDRFPGFAWGEGAINPTDARYFHMDNASDDGWIQENSNTSFRLDAKYDLSIPVVQSVEFGIRTTEEVAERTSRFRFKCTTNYATQKTPIDLTFNAAKDRACENPAISPTYISLRDNPNAYAVLDGIWDQSGQLSPQGGFLQIDPDFRIDRFEEWKKFVGFYDIDPDYDATSTATRKLTAPKQQYTNVNGGYSMDPLETYTLTENTYAAYAKVNFEGELGIFEYRGNLGVRSVQTKVETESPVEDQNAKSDYNNLLPSANIAFTYETNSVARYAVSKVMARPNYGDVKGAPELNLNSGCQNFDETDPFAQNDIKDLSLPIQFADGRQVILASTGLPPTLQNRKDATGNGNDGFSCEGIRARGTNTMGNPDLKPYDAINHDISLEHYWGEGSGNSVSLTFFYKDVKADLLTETVIVAIPSSSPDLINPDLAPLTDKELWYAARKVNGRPSTRSGIEFGYTQFADFLPEGWMQGFGIQFNYTRAKGTRSPAVWVVLDRNTRQRVEVDRSTPGAELLDSQSYRPLSGLSVNSYNFSLFYEKYGFQTRLAYNYRDAFYQSGVNWRGEQKTLDFSSSYEFTKNISGNFNVNNILRKGQHNYNETPNRTNETNYGDIIYTLGVTAKFDW